jgi:DNA-binding NtrC family response regulator
MNARIAIVDDERRMREIIAMYLQRKGFDVEAFGGGEAMLDAADESVFDLVITDLKMPGMSGMELLRELVDRDEDRPVVVITAHGSVDSAMEAVRAGAWDFIQKPFDNDQLRATVERALERTRLARENRRLRAEVRDTFDLDGMVAESDAMREALDLARRAAASPATVLITGDSGTGKERVARAIHYWSDRVGEPFVAVNCKAFSSSVLESELFGHVEGAFTGASGNKRGVFERADGGTVFLDEIGEVSEDFQAKLLRVLQEREVLPVGAETTRPIDVRVLAATNRDLERDIEEGRFREDLYYRLAVIPIELAPLAERPEDILPLARAFLLRSSREMGRDVTGWSDEVEDYLVGHDWPGNVRELENAIERAVVLARGETIELEDIAMGSPTGSRSGDEDLQAYLDRMTRKKIREVLAAEESKTDAAERLGIDRTTLYRMMKRLGVE